VFLSALLSQFFDSVTLFSVSSSFNAEGDGTWREDVVPQKSVVEKRFGSTIPIFCCHVLTRACCVPFS